jgi:hypothetical protein
VLIREAFAFFPTYQVKGETFMKRGVCLKRFIFISLTLSIIAVISPELNAQGGNINVNGFFSVDAAQQGSTFQAAIVMDIPKGLYVNSNRPLGKYAIPTILKIDTPKGMRITPVSYPRANVRTFRFGIAAAERLAVYEGRVIFRFNISVPANYELGRVSIRVSVRFQAASDEAALAPVTRELTIPITIVNRDTPTNRINNNLFGGDRRRT